MRGIESGHRTTRTAVEPRRNHTTMNPPLVVAEPDSAEKAYFMADAVGVWGVPESVRQISRFSGFCL
jgi:hypothetical protein